MLIDFNKIDSMTFPGMDNGTGTMSARMYNDDSYRIIPTSIHPGGSIGTHKQNSGDDMNYIISGTGKAFCDGVEELLMPGVMHICPQCSEHSIINTGEMKYTITQIKGGTDNCYIISNGDNAILFDTASGNNLQQVKDECSKYNMKLIVLSHPHFDHAENAEELSKYFNIPVAYNEQDDNIFDDYRSQPLKSYGLVGFVVLNLSLRVLSETKVTRPVNRFFVKEGDMLGDYGFPDIKVVELPGHSRGSIGLLVSDDAILVGDALDNWIKPRVGHLYTDFESLKKSAEKIRSYGKRTYYYGHGKPTESFTIK